MPSPDPVICTVFMFVCLLLAGVAQTIWMKSDYSKRFSAAIDGGRTFRNCRIFGQNKTWRGFVVMVPATGVTFVFVHAVARWWHGPGLPLWPLSTVQYFLLGCGAGFGFMLGELPNSFLKRQFGIAPGEPGSSPRSRRLCFVIDQVDSVVGGLMMVWLFVPVPLATVVSLLICGAVAHYAFNCLLLHMGLRTRAA